MGSCSGFDLILSFSFTKTVSTEEFEIMNRKWLSETPINFWIRLISRFKGNFGELFLLKGFALPFTVQDLKCFNFFKDLEMN